MLSVTTLRSIKTIHIKCHADELPLFGDVEGLSPPGGPRLKFSGAAFRDRKKYHISRPDRDAKDRLL